MRVGCMVLALSLDAAAVPSQWDRSSQRRQLAVGACVAPPAVPPCTDDEEKVWDVGTVAWGCVSICNERSILNSGKQYYYDAPCRRCDVCAAGDATCGSLVGGGASGGCSTGSSCQSPSCGVHGDSINGVCVCHEGWATSVQGNLTTQLCGEMLSGMVVEPTDPEHTTTYDDTDTWIWAAAAAVVAVVVCSIAGCVVIFALRRRRRHQRSEHAEHGQKRAAEPRGASPTNGGRDRGGGRRFDRQEPQPQPARTLEFVEPARKRTVRAPSGVEFSFEHYTQLRADVECIPIEHRGPLHVPLRFRGGEGAPTPKVLSS